MNTQETRKSKNNNQEWNEEDYNFENNDEELCVYTGRYEPFFITVGEVKGLLTDIGLTQKQINNPYVINTFVGFSNLHFIIDRKFNVTDRYQGVIDSNDKNDIKETFLKYVDTSKQYDKDKERGINFL